MSQSSMDTSDVAELVDRLCIYVEDQRPQLFRGEEAMLREAADALQSLSLELERVKSERDSWFAEAEDRANSCSILIRERDEAREASDEFMREMGTMADSIEAALARANAAEAESARLREALSRETERCAKIAESADRKFRNTGSLVAAAIRARPDMEGGKP